MWLFLIVLGLFFSGSPAPLPAILPGHPSHEYDPASASKFAPTSGISRRESSDQGLFPALFAPIFETFPSDLLDIRSFFLFISLCALGSIIAIVPLKQFHGRRVHSLFYSIALFCAAVWKALDLGPWVSSPCCPFSTGQHSRSALDII